ncbi:MAG: hypothetical protein IJ088_10015 [Clostridia bacterium]|nr:hypothetical protein [Clostridia bacterium]
MIRLHNLKVPLDYTEASLPALAARKLRISPDLVSTCRIARKSVDARKKSDICFALSLDLTLSPAKEEERCLRLFPENEVSRVTPFVPPVIPQVSSPTRPVVIGFGPAGIFSALWLAEAGLRPIVLERGRDARRRTRDVQAYFTEGAPAFSPVSNVQFGEGGAGTFSDGKLNSGIKDPRIQAVLHILVRFGAPPEILYDATPHIGTDRLADCIIRIRKHICSLGGEVRFESRMTRLIREDGHIRGVEYESEGQTRTLETDFVVLSIGHSARDTFESLYGDHFTLVRKPFSMGVRIEHPQALINAAQYGHCPPQLGAADYKLAVHLPDGRSVYTFCMCPGGSVIAAASEKDTIVTNGMSRYARDDRNANSALLVGIAPEDFPDSSPLSGMYWQRAIEQKAFLLGGSSGRAPAQLVGDFLRQVPSQAPRSVQPSYLPGVTYTDLDRLYPPLFTDALRSAIPLLARKLRGFDHPDAVLTAPETRSSCPVRLPRTETFQSVDAAGLFPCGEGAGYAGGITSAAVDGIRCAEQIISLNM